MWVTFTCDENGRTLSGTDVLAALIVMQGMGVDAFGLNCSSGPAEMLEQMRRLTPYTTVPLIAKPNAGLPETVEGQAVYHCPPEEFASYAAGFAAAGVRIFGGCCGTTPAHIAALRAALDALPETLPAAPAAAVSTAAKPEVEKDDAFLRKLNAGKKVIAIELDSPKDADLTGYLDLSLIHI